MMEEEGTVIVGLLVGLNVLDANLCLKGEDLDSQVKRQSWLWVECLLWAKGFPEDLQTWAEPKKRANGRECLLEGGARCCAGQRGRPPGKGTEAQEMKVEAGLSFQAISVLSECLAVVPGALRGHPRAAWVAQ